MSEEDTFPRLLRHQAERRSARAAVREKRRGIWHTTTWRQLHDEAAALAAALVGTGLVRGAHVAFLGENRPRLLAAMVASQWLGAVVVPLYPDATAAEIAGPLREAGVTHAFAENQEQVDKLLEVQPSCPALRCIVFDKDRGLRHYHQPGLIGHEALLARGVAAAASLRNELELELARGLASDPACVIYTSGTTGPARGVVLTHGALIDRARAAASADGLGEDDMSLAYLPPAWIGQHLFGYALPLFTGGCVCCPESSESMLADMRETGPTLFLATPRVLEALQTQVFVRMQDAGPLQQALYRRSLTLAARLNRSGPGAAGLMDRLAHAAAQAAIFGPLRDVLGLTRVSAAYCTGEALGGEQLAFYRSIGVNLKQFYGSTEAGGLVALQQGVEVSAEDVGSPAQGVELKLSPSGELLVRSPSLFSGYQGPAAAQAPALVDGWLRTGDAGRIEADGRLRLIDRVGDIGTLADGSAFAPKPIENRLKFSPYIHEAVVFGPGRDGVCALIDIEAPTVGPWADRQEISYAGHADLASHESVYRLIAECISSVNADLARDPGTARSQVRRFVVLPKPLDPDDGVMTRMRKLRRGAIALRYAGLVDAMYGSSDHVTMTDAQGQSVELRIGRATTVALERVHA
ncbi:MAG: AMP-dependent synthetase/ligase [Rubrivivax sp.]